MQKEKVINKRIKNILIIWIFAVCKGEVADNVN